MAVSPAIEARALDALMAALGTIGIPPSNWLTTPAPVIEGMPGDPLPQPAAGKPVLMVNYLRTVPDQGEQGISRHNWTLHFAVWVAADSVRNMMAAKADVARAIFNAETSSAQLAQADSFYVDQFEYRQDMLPAGFGVGVLGVFIDVTVDHAAP